MQRFDVTLAIMSGQRLILIEAIRLFEVMNDQKGLLEIHLVICFDYYVALRDFSNARKALDIADLILRVP